MSLGLSNNLLVELVGVTRGKEKFYSIKKKASKKREDLAVSCKTRFIIHNLGGFVKKRGWGEPGDG